VEAENEAIKSHGTYEEVDCSFNKKVKSTKWILRVEKDSNNNGASYKARSVARGFSQPSRINYDLTFSPTLSKQAFHVLLCIAANRNCSVQHLYVQNTILNRDIDCPIYIELPEISDITKITKSSKVWLLKKSLYCL
jgi:Reverse transcriptase (RNA-dependent DNA polymerase)